MVYYEAFRDTRGCFPTGIPTERDPVTGAGGGTNIVSFAQHAPMPRIGKVTERHLRGIGITKARAI